MTDLTAEEQARVRLALRFLRARSGGWERLASSLGFKRHTIVNVSKGRTITASLAFRTAKLAGVPVDDLLSGKYPAPGACPHCGHIPPAPPAP